MANTSLRQRADFPEVKDKIVNSIEVSSDDEYFGVTISFQDRTALTLTVESCVALFPVLADWANGEEKPVKRYKTIRSKIERT